MAVRLSRTSKLIMLVVLAVGVVFTMKYFGLAPGMKTQQSVVPQKFALPDAAVAVEKDPNVLPVTLPSNRAATGGSGQIRFSIWEWNAQMGFLFANGGPTTTSGSLMEKHGVRVAIERQDDTEKSKLQQIKLADLMANGESNPSEGVHFVVIMGDGAAQYLAAINKVLTKHGDDYRAEIVGSIGYSRGEDTFMGPAEWKTDPNSMRGGLTAGVLRDGDWNIAMYDMQQNEIPNNPDEKTYDPDAMNWLGTDDYLKAAEVLINGTCEDRPVVHQGKKTGETKHVCVQGAVTWTPGDVNIAKAKGGLVKILSTRENVFQMPSVVIGIHKWDAAHHKQVEEMLAAAFEGADQVRNFDQALRRAGQISTAVYKDQTPDYWVKYFKGVTEADRTGAMVPLGGSMVSNLADNLFLFGLGNEGTGLGNSTFRATYEGFGNIVKQQYPKLFPSFPSVDQAVDTSYVQALASRTVLTNADVQKFDSNAGPIAKESQVARRNWNIQFQSGKATFTPEAEAVLNQLFNQLAIGGGLAVEIDGHTDNVGDPTSNQNLSERRAFAVKEWLQHKSSVLFPEGRVTIQAFGQTRPIVPNDSSDNMAKNRRVEIILGTK